MTLLKGKDIFSEGYERSVDLLKELSSESGFLASPARKANYHRVWARDGVIMGLAAILSSEKELIEAFKRTLVTLINHQGPHGEIPSNVDTGSGRISYGGTTGRVDADLWFVIGIYEYWRVTEDDGFLEYALPALEKVRFLLGAWEFNNRGLLYVPITGDWADEYLHNGYVLYDQLLYYKAQRAICDIHEKMHKSSDHVLMERASRLKHLIRANYWIHGQNNSPPEDVYHEILYEKAREAAEHVAGCFWAPFFSPQGYGYRFDAFANVLASLLDVADDDQRECVDGYIEQEATDEKLALLPAFLPVIRPVDKDWKNLKMTFSYSFKNKPYEYHNGGLWPMITGFYVADLARRDKLDKAKKYLGGIHKANAMEMNGEEWGFPEYAHGKRHTPGGEKRQGWSAAAAIIGARAMEGRRVFSE